MWVTWTNALAFCRWLSDKVQSNKVQLSVDLPSEAEWEKAARGTDGRLYPWGDELPDINRCNFGMALNDTTRVGSYSPQGDSPYGCADMSGNLWEWTRSILVRYPYDLKDGREDMKTEGLRVLRVAHSLRVKRWSDAHTARQTRRLQKIGPMDLE